MKPSEFITKFKVYKEKNNIVLKPVTFEDLDLRFIDREELKDKINKIDNLFSLTYSKFYDKDAQIKGAEKMKKKILELLK